MQHKSTRTARVSYGTLVLAGSLSLLAGGCTRCAGKISRSGFSTAPADRQHRYDTRVLERSLRRGEKALLLRQLKLHSLSDLPLYELEIELDPRRARFVGRCTLHYPNRTTRPLRALALLLHPNAARELGGAAKGVEAAELELTDAKTLAGPGVHLEHVRPTLVTLQLDAPLEVGAWLHVRLRYRGRLRRLGGPETNDLFAQGMASIGILAGASAHAGYGLLGMGDGIATLASAYPMVAPFRRGVFDVAPPPRFGDMAYNTPANFRLRVQVPRGYRVVTNLRDDAARAGADGTQVFVAAGAAVRDLVLVAGRDLSDATTHVGAVAVRSVFRRRDTAAGGRMLETAKEALALFERRFGPYPYREFDVAEATLVGGAGGVEFPGMVLVAGMFYRPPSQSGNQMAQLLRSLGDMSGVLGSLSATARKGVGPEAPGLVGGDLDQLVDRLGRFVAAHEVAHQFFAGLVGSDCREDPAFDEPLAQFSAGQYVRQRYGEAEGERLFALNAKANYAVYRMTGPDLPAAQPLAAFPNAMAYAGIVYGKAPYFYEALRERLGAKRFDTALRNATAAQRYHLVTLDAWIATLGEAAHAPATVRRLAKRYFYDLHGDEDLGVDASGRALFEMVLGKRLASRLRDSFEMLGISPKALFAPFLGRKR